MGLAFHKIVSRFTTFGAIVVLVGCGSITPTAPTPLTPIAAADLQVSGDGRWMACLSIGLDGLLSCDFSGELRNTGAGCATAVHGVTRFMSNGQPIGDGFSWTASAAMVLPGEVVGYRSGTVPGTTVKATTSYSTEPAWTNVRCP